MLVVTRKVGQKIILSNGIEIVITQVKGGKARVGVNAPDGITILREEVVNRMSEDKKADYLKSFNNQVKECAEHLQGIGNHE